MKFGYNEMQELQNQIKSGEQDQHEKATTTLHELRIYVSQIERTLEAYREVLRYETARG